MSRVVNVIFKRDYVERYRPWSTSKLIPCPNHRTSDGTELDPKSWQNKSNFGDLQLIVGPHEPRRGRDLQTKLRWNMLRSVHLQIYFLPNHRFTEERTQTSSERPQICNFRNGRLVKLCNQRFLPNCHETKTTAVKRSLFSDHNVFDHSQHSLPPQTFTSPMFLLQNYPKCAPLQLQDHFPPITFSITRNFPLPPQTFYVPQCFCCKTIIQSVHHCNYKITFLRSQRCRSLVTSFSTANLYVSNVFVAKLSKVCTTAVTR